MSKQVLNSLANIDLGLKGQSQPHHGKGGIHPISVRLDTLQDSYTPGASEQANFQRVDSAECCHTTLAKILASPCHYVAGAATGRSEHTARGFKRRRIREHRARPEASSGGGSGNIGQLRWLQLALARCAEPGARLAHVPGVSDAPQRCHTCTGKRTAWAPVTGMMEEIHDMRVKNHGCKFL